MLLIIDLRTQAREGTLFVLRLVTGLCTLNEDLLHLAGIGVLPVITQTNTGLDLIDVLSSGSTGTEGLPLDLAFVDMYFKLIRFGQYGYGSRRGMDTSLGLGHGHTLHAMHTRFVFERTIDILSHDVEDDLFVAAYGTFAK